MFSAFFIFCHSDKTLFFPFRKDIFSAQEIFTCIKKNIVVARILFLGKAFFLAVRKKLLRQGKKNYFVFISRKYFLGTRNHFCGSRLLILSAFEWLDFEDENFVKLRPVFLAKNEFDGSSNPWGKIGGVDRFCRWQLRADFTIFENLGSEPRFVSLRRAGQRRRRSDGGAAGPMRWTSATRTAPHGAAVRASWKGCANHCSDRREMTVSTDISDGQTIKLFRLEWNFSPLQKAAREATTSV